MRGAPNAIAGDCQHHTSMLRAASSRPAHSVATGQHNTEQGLSVSMAGRSIHVDSAMAAHSASMASRSIHVGSAMAAHSASMMYVELVARRASLWAI